MVLPPARLLMSVIRSSQGSRTGSEHLFQQSPELVIAQRAETDQDSEPPETLHRVPHELLSLGDLAGGDGSDVSFADGAGKAWVASKGGTLEEVGLRCPRLDRR